MTRNRKLALLAACLLLGASAGAHAGRLLVPDLDADQQLLGGCVIRWRGVAAAARSGWRAASTPATASITARSADSGSSPTW